MRRVVIDTNIGISGMLWRGAPWRLLRMAEQGEIELCVSPSMLSQLAIVLSYEWFQPRITELGFTSEELIAYALSQAAVLEVPQGEPVVAADPTDDVFLHCAAAVGASCVVSGDRHLTSRHQKVAANRTSTIDANATFQDLLESGQVPSRYMRSRRLQR